MQTIWHDLRYAWRQLRRAPVFAATAVLTLALGIGANTAIFSLLDQALLRSLPVRDPQQLVVLEGTGTVWEGHSSSHGGDREAYFSYPMYKDLRDKGTRAFEGLLATAPANIGWLRGSTAERARAELVSGNYFSVLGVRPFLGRLLLPADDEQTGAHPLAVVSFDFWRVKLGGDPHIAGETVEINGHPFQVIGVAAEGFRSAIWGETPDVFVPMAMLDVVVPGKGKRLADHTDKWLNILGRLHAGETRAQAEAAMQPLWHALRAEELKALGSRSQRFTDDFLTNSRMRIVPGARGFSYDRDSYSKPLLAVMAMALLVLLMAAVNVASLLLVRCAGRMREFAVRYALGAGRARIAQQLLLEGLLLGTAGGAAGLLLAPVALRALVRQLLGDRAYGSFTAQMDLRLLCANFAFALAVSIAFSLAPVFQLRRLHVASAGSGARTSVARQSSGAGAAPGFRRAVVCLQVGLSVLLLAGAGLFVRTMEKLRAVNPGYSTAHLVTFGINPKLAGYTPERVPLLEDRVIDAVTALPGVVAVAASKDAELVCCGDSGNVTVAGHTDPPDSDFDVETPFVNPEYFAAMGIPLLAGRGLTQADDATHPRVAIVNEAFARHFCGAAQSCLGRLMASGGGNHVKLDTEIVGVVQDTRHDGLRSEVVPTYFRPRKQDPFPAQLYLYLRTYADPALLLPVVRRTMQQLDPTLALVDLRTMDAQIDENLSNERMIALLAVSFGVLATVLAGVGLYGVLAYATAQRTREIGIRMALGSSRVGAARVVLADVGRLTGLGVVGALPVAVALGRLLRSQLYGVSPADPWTLGMAVLLVVGVALLASALPARRAALVQPMEALRTE